MGKKNATAKTKVTSKKNYLDSHWGFFAAQGIVALGFGAFALITESTDIPKLITIAAIALATMGVIEMANALYRRKCSQSSLATATIAALEMAVAVILFLTHTGDHMMHVMLLAGYAIVRGAFELFLGLRTLKDKTDKTIWTMSGAFGAILGFVLLADPGNAPTTFIQIFGIYIAILGLSHLIYALHSRKARK